MTENIGPWKINVVSTEQAGLFSLRGIKIDGPKSVLLDLTKGILVIDDEPFVGRPLVGNSPIVRGAAFKGAVFERDNGKATGSASLLVLEDGRAVVDFYKVWISGQRGEYGILSPEK